MKGKEKFKRWMAVLLTFAMTASLSVAVFAEDETSPDSESMAVESVESTEMETADSAETVTASETVDIEETTVDGEPAESEPEEQTELETIAEEVTNEVKLFSVSENDVCQIGETGYASLKEAFENANENDRIVLKKSVAADEIINVAKSVVLDLNGFTITNNVSGERLFNVSAPSFTVEGGTAGSGMIIPEENTNSYGFIKVIAASQVVLNGGEYSGNTDDGAFVRLFNQPGVGDASGSTITLNNVQATTNNSFLTTDTLTTDASTPTLHVNGGTYVTERKGFGLDIIPPSPVSFTGVTVTAGSGPVIELSGGDAVFEDCTFDVTATTDNSHFQTTAVAVSWSGIATIKGGSYSSTGYGIYVYSSGGTIIVEDGDISGDVKAAEADVDPTNYGATSTIKIQGGNVKGTLGTNNQPNATIEVTGGKFDTDVSTYVPADMTIQKNDDGSFSVWALDPPVINVKAENTTIHEGKNVILTAEVSHELDNVSFAYSWYKDGVLLQDATESTLTVTEGGSYTVKVSAFDGALKSDEVESAPVVCTIEGHVFGSDWKNDEANHWHECVCGEKAETAAHTEDKGTVTTPATETEAGVKTYSCTVCGRVLRTEVIPAAGQEHVHNYGKDWKHDEANHWHECICGEKADAAAHISDDGKVTKAATATEAGVKTYSCTVCGRILKTEAIPATGETGETGTTGGNGTTGGSGTTGSTGQQSNNNGANGPVTGDNTNLMLWMVIMAAAAAVAVDMGVYILKTRKH